MKNHPAAGTPALFVALTLGASSAFAQAQTQTSPNQTATTPTTGGIEEVTVTARYREENLQQTPIAISASTVCTPCCA